MPEMPTLGAQPKQSPIIPVAITAVVVGLVAGGIFWVRSRPADGPAAPTVPSPALAQNELAPNGPVAIAPHASPALDAVKSPLKTFQVKLSGPLESAIIASEGKEVGAPLTQVVNRSLVWWLRVPQDLVRGDTLCVVYETRDGQEPLVHAVRFESRKLGQTFETYRYQPSEGFARYYQADGSELEERLIDSPLETYEQITSLLRDGRKHRGVDFKTPVGTPVLATFDGVVTRKNWNFRGNGNSIELQESGGQGRTAMFLHLSEVPSSLNGGRRIKKGEVIGKSGNTGHSFAPHLHYQLMRGATVVDPFDSQKTTRVSVPSTERASFEKRMAELRALIPASELAGG